MPDREKVIKGLEYCGKQSGCWSDESECPWVSECREDVNSLKDAVLELLKEQEAVEPLPQNYNGWVRTIKLWYCGACHSKISRRTSKYCPNCGKPILWKCR